MAEYIEREAVVKYIRSREGNFIDDMGKGWSNGMDAAASICEKFPAADVVPVVHGKWKKDTTVQVMAPGGQKYHFSCSVCGYITRLHNLNYCPNCGAKMNG